MEKKTAKKLDCSPADDKKKALETTLSQIEKAYGKGAIMKLGENASMNVSAVSTGLADTRYGTWYRRRAERTYYRNIRT